MSEQERMTSAEYLARQRRRIQGGQTVKAQPQGKVEPPAPLIVELPLPPSVNSLYTNVPGKGRVLTKKGREYKRNAVSIIAGTAMRNRFKIPEDVRLSFSITFYFADYRRDLDDALKSLIDCHATALGFNDNRVDNLEILRGEPDKAHPRCEVILSILK